jgi:hypothetical protein
MAAAGSSHFDDCSECPILLQSVNLRAEASLLFGLWKSTPPNCKLIAVPVPGWYWSTSPISITSGNVTIGSNSTARVTVVTRRMLQQADGSTAGGGVLTAYAADAAGGFSGGYWDQHQDEGHVEPCPADSW